MKADEDFALAVALDALQMSYRNDVAGARARVAEARALAVGATKRERRQVETIGAMIAGDGRKALRLIKEHLTEFPRDMLMVRLASRILILGCSGAGVANFPEELLAMLKPIAGDYGDDWAFLGQYSFAHHETGYFDEALGYATRALEMRADSGTASHSVAHVYFETGDPGRGLGLSGRLAGWVRPARSVQRASVLASGAVPARYGQAGERGVAVRGAYPPVGGEEESGFASG